MRSDLRSPNSPDRAILLLGSTGSGKTPLGDAIADEGLWKNRCIHFDFGANLRSIVERNEPDALISRDDLDFLNRVLATGILLENEHFPIAERILRSFLDEHRADGRTVVVLNGLPRHVGQAEAVDSILSIEAVIHLSCTPEAVLERIRTNAGGDRADRRDDDLDSVKAKLRLFEDRTVLLVEYYRRRDVRVEAVEVTSSTTAGDIRKFLDSRKCL